MKNKKQLRETMHSNSRAVEENERCGNRFYCVMKSDLVQKCKEFCGHSDSCGLL
jgi:hypothetical protein